jgi:hypothetical protein
MAELLHQLRHFSFALTEIVRNVRLRNEQNASPAVSLSISFERGQRNDRQNTEDHGA